MKNIQQIRDELDNIYITSTKNIKKFITIDNVNEVSAQLCKLFGDTHDSLRKLVFELDEQLKLMSEEDKTPVFKPAFKPALKPVEQPPINYINSETFTNNDSIRTPIRRAIASQNTKLLDKLTEYRQQLIQLVSNADNTLPIFKIELMKFKYYSLITHLEPFPLEPEEQNRFDKLCMDITIEEFKDYDNGK